MGILIYLKNRQNFSNSCLVKRVVWLDRGSRRTGHHGHIRTQGKVGGESKVKVGLVGEKIGDVLGKRRELTR